MRDRDVSNQGNCGMKKCTKCGEEKDLSEFYTNKGNRSGIHSECKMCHLQYKRKNPSTMSSNWKNRNPEKVKEYRKKYEETHREDIRNRRLKYRYGITTEIFDKLKNDQNGRCAICGGLLGLKVDHNHTTGKVRGLLCNGCNRGLGFFVDNINFLESAIVYLNKNK